MLVNENAIHTDDNVKFTNNQSAFWFKALNYEIRIVTGNSNRKLAADIARNLHVRITKAGE